MMQRSQLSGLQEVCATISSSLLLLQGLFFLWSGSVINSIFDDAGFTTPSGVVMNVVIGGVLIVTAVAYWLQIYGVRKFLFMGSPLLVAYYSWMLWSSLDAVSMSNVVRGDLVALGVLSSGGFIVIGLCCLIGGYGDYRIEKECFQK